MAVDYLLKEVSFSTCDNRFFGELEKEMLIPNNVNIFGKIKRAASLKDFELRLEFPQESAIGYVKQPISSSIEDNKRVLTYRLEDLLNYDDYWWLPLKEETEFLLPLNLLPPFPDINPVDLQITCRPDIVTGVQAEVTTAVRIEGEETIDNMFLKLTAPTAFSGISMAITEFSGDSNKNPRPSVTVPVKNFPFPRLSLSKGEALEYKVKTTIMSNPANMTSLRCQQDILNTKLLLLSDSSPDLSPCGVKILNSEGEEVPIQKTVRSTLLQANAQVMYSPFSIRREAIPTRPQTVIASPAQ